MSARISHSPRVWRVEYAKGRSRLFSLAQNLLTIDEIDDFTQEIMHPCLQIFALRRVFEHETKKHRGRSFKTHVSKNMSTFEPNQFADGFGRFELPYLQAITDYFTKHKVNRTIFFLTAIAGARMVMPFVFYSTEKFFKGATEHENAGIPKKSRHAEGSE